MNTANTARTKVEVVVYNDKKEIMILAPCRRSPWWAIPGGGIDDGETDEQACIRECLEESGYAIKNIQSLMMESVFDGMYSGRHVRKITRFYMAQVDKVDKHLFNQDGDGRVAHWGTAQYAVSKLSDTEFDKPRKDAIERTAQILSYKD